MRNPKSNPEPIEVGPRRFVPSMTMMREKLVNSPWLDKLSKSDKLLSKNFETRIRELLEVNEKIVSIVSESTSPLTLPSLLTNFSIQNSLETSFLASASIPNELSLQTVSFDDLRRKYQTKEWELLNQVSLELAEKTDSFCREFGIIKKSQDVHLEMLSPSVVHACGDCFRIRKSGESTDMCEFCNSTVPRSLSISRLTQVMEYFIKENVWLEYAVARSLKKNQNVKDVYSGFHWLGKSGVGHEIDIFVRTKGDRIGLVECTRSYLALDEVMKLKSKIDDLQSDFGLLFSISGVEPDSKKFGKTYNVHTFPEILERPNETIELLDRTLNVIS